MPVAPSNLAARAALAIAFAGACTCAGASALSPDQFYARTAPSVWRVFSYDADGIAFATGSAVVIGKETLLTNCHVLAKAKRIEIKQDNVSYGARLQYIDVPRDMCQITARNLYAPAVELGDSDKLAVGQRVFALGNPKGLELTLSDGLISALRKDSDANLVSIQTTAPISHGSSGGGLFDENGRLIGLTTMQVTDAQNLNFAVPINWLRDLQARSQAALAPRTTAIAVAVSRVPPPARPADKGVEPPRAADTAPAASAYADINDVDKVARISPRVRPSYELFLTRPLPRAFALSESGGSWTSWGRKPKDPDAAPDPAVRAIADCQKFHNSPCRLYAVDKAVVYKP